MIASSKQKVEPKGKFLIDPETWGENRCQRRSPSTDQPFPGAHLGELLQTLRWYSFCSLHGLLHNTSIIILAFIHQFQIACRLTLTFNFAKSYISFFTDSEMERIPQHSTITSWHNSVQGSFGSNQMSVMWWKRPIRKWGWGHWNQKASIFQRHWLFPGGKS